MGSEMCIRDSPIRLCGVDHAQGRLPEASRHSPQNVASDHRCLVQVAGTPNPLIPCAREDIVGRGAHSNGQQQIDQTCHGGDPRDPRLAWTGRQEERVDGLRGRRPPVILDRRSGGIGNCGIRSRQVVGNGDRGGRTFMPTWKTEEERAAEVRRNKRETEKADKTPIAPGVTTGQLRRFSAAFIGPLLSPGGAVRTMSFQ